MLSCLAVLFIAIGSWQLTERLQRDAARALAQRDVEFRADQVRDTLVLIDERLREITNSPLLHTALTDSIGREDYLLPYMSSIQRINSLKIELLLVDFQGKEVARNSDISLGVAERDLLQQLLASQRTTAFVSPDGQANKLLFSQMVQYPLSGTMEGALWASVSVDALMRDSGYRLIRGSVSPTAMGSAPGNRPQDDAGIQAPVVLPASFGDLELAVQGNPAAAISDVGRFDLTLAAVLAAALCLMVAMALVGRHLAHRLTADLRTLQQFAVRVAEGSFSTDRAPETGATEVSSLAGSINRMLDQLKCQHDRLQEAARQQLHLLGTSIANLNDVVMITRSEPDPVEGHVIFFVNEAFTRLTGWERDEVIGKSPRLLQGPLTDRAELDRIKQSLRDWQPVRAELVNYRKDGTSYWVEMDISAIRDEQGRITHWVSVERETTARHAAETTRLALEAQLQQAQKTEAIGTLAAGIAHDFNNILAVVLGSLALARQDLARGRSADARLDQIERSAGRARSLVEQILLFSRRQDSRLKNQPVDLKLMLNETVSLLRATVPARVQLDSQTCEAPAVVLGDPVAVEQVLLNLGTNAWQSLSGSSGALEFGLSTLALTTDPNGLASVVCAGAGPVAPALPPLPALATGAYAHLWLADDGCGMDEATQTRIFEPFFTTKAPGSGTGLGLSVVHGIVRALGGAIVVKSAPGHGSCFHVLLPLHAQSARSEATADRAAPAQQGRGQHVLYVDDDEVMGAIASGLLEQWGYAVTAPTSAAAAVAAVRANPLDYDLVITDYNMPDLSGLDVLRALKVLRADLPVVVTSGYIPDAMQAEATAAGAFAVLRKENLQDELPALAAQALAEG